MGGIEFASENMTLLRLVGGFPPPTPMFCFRNIDRYLSTSSPQLKETTPLRVVLMESSSQVKTRFVGIMCYVMGL